MTYPGSEQVSYTYNGQMMLQGMEGTNIYIQSTTYDAAGRMTERVLGNGMTKAYSYYPWSQQGGRLQNLTTGSMQNMSYTYDEAGNETTITDTLAGPQTQEFSYNAADMVIQASAAGGTYGLYSENYSYSSGNLYNKGGVTNTYGDPDHPHAVTERSNGNTYVYDDNGNQTRREIGNDTYDLKYDAENRLVEVKKNSTVIATFVYDGDGKQVKGTMNGATTYYVGAYYQKQGTLVTKYYYAGVERIAMRQGGVLYYIFGDHLGSTAVVKNTQGGKSELRYTAWGTTRYEYGSTPTDRRYTGQREEASLGLYFYNARWYDPALGRFIQADTIVPGAGNPQAWDRYAYANNNPVKYSDPSGHSVDCGIGEQNCRAGIYNSTSLFEITGPISSGAVYAGVSFPDGIGKSFESTAEENYNPYYPQAENMKRYSDMTSSEKSTFIGSWLSVFVDMAPSFLPKNITQSPSNVFAVVNWQYYDNEFTIPQIRIVNNSYGFVRIKWTSFEDSSGSEKIFIGPKEAVGHEGNAPGILLFDISPQQFYSRNDIVKVTIALKFSALAYPQAVSMLIPGHGLTAGLTPVFPWYE